MYSTQMESKMNAKGFYVQKPPKTRDHYEVFESRTEATERYNQILEQDTTYSVNICKVIKSTDYGVPDEA
jgi:hypothetical protein